MITDVGLGEATDALVTAAYVTRTREDDRTVLDTPVRRDFWHGHGFVLDAPPDERRLDATIEEGRARFGALGATCFVVRWERPYESADPLDAYVPAPRVERDRAVIMRFAGDVPAASARVEDLRTETWGEAAELAAAEYADEQDFVRWRFATFRADVRRGRARVVCIRDGERLVAVAGLYRGDTVARFVTPVTAPDARRRGYFTACAHTLIAWALASGPRTVAIAVSETGPFDLYRRLGFVPVAWHDAFVVRL